MMGVMRVFDQMVIRLSDNKWMNIICWNIKLDEYNFL
jgi:hypothetical protein